MIVLLATHTNSLTALIYRGFLTLIWEKAEDSFKADILPR